MGAEWGIWSSVSEGSTTPGAPVTSVAIGGGRAAVFLADPNGGIYATEGSATGGWAPWTSVSEGRATPGAPVTVLEMLSSPGRYAVFLADPGGGVFTTQGSLAGGWQPWTSVSEGSTTPGGHVTALADGRFGKDLYSLFLADPNGGVYTARGSYEAGWSPWTSVSEGRTSPGAPITALTVGPRPNDIALILADPNGGVYSVFGSHQDGWGLWTSWPGVTTTPGAPITAVRLADQLLFLVADVHGTIVTTSYGETPTVWLPVAGSTGAVVPGGFVGAIRRPWNDSVLAIHVADADGRVSTTYGRPFAWAPWTSVRDGRTAPGGVVTPSWRYEDARRLDLFLADPGGGVFTVAQALQPAGPVTDLHVTGTAPDRVGLAWSYPYDDATGFHITWQGSRAGVGGDGGATDVGAGRAATVLGLQPGYAYTLQVQVVTAVGVSPPSNTVTATTANPPQTVTVDLQRQEVIEGLVPYLATFPHGANRPGHLLSVSLPHTDELGTTLAFIKPGHSTDQGADPDAVVVIPEGHTTTPAELIAMFGTSSPPFSVAAPIPFLAVLYHQVSTPLLPSYVPVSISYQLD